MSEALRPIRFRIVLITDPAATGGVVAATRAALRGAASHPPGTVAVQLRMKDAHAAELLDVARGLREACARVGAALLVHGDLDLAREVGADGVHLPEAGLAPVEARRRLGEGMLLGCSRHDRAGLERAQRDGADYATLAPIGSVPGKGEALGVAGLARGCAGLSIPVFALGGVDATNAAEMRDAGAHGVAIIRAVYAAIDPAAALAGLLRALDR